MTDLTAHVYLCRSKLGGLQAEPACELEPTGFAQIARGNRFDPWRAAADAAGPRVHRGLLSGARMHASDAD